MKKYMYAALAAAFALVLSCSRENIPSGEEVDIPVGPSGQITITATLSDGLTKVSFDPSYDADNKPEGMALTWASGDAIRVYNHADRSQYQDFTLDAGSIGQKTGSFSGTAISAASYDVEVIGGAGFDYAAQTQPSDGVTTGLKYLASASGIASYAAVEFTGFSSVLAITAKMPSTAVAAVIKSVDIMASEAIFNGGKTLTITLDAPGDAGSDGVLNLFATLPEGTTAVPAGTTLLVHFNAPGEAHDVYTRFIELGAQSFTANKLNAININATRSDIHAGLVTSDGTSAAKAYLVGDKYQMQAMGGLMAEGETRYFKLIDDIDLTGASWTSLNADPFTSAVNLDGNGKTVNALNAPLFDDLKGSVKDIIVSNAAVSRANTAGILANTVKTASTVEGVTVQNSTLTYEEAEGSHRVGGLVGDVSSASTFDDCHIVGATITASKAKDTGGAFGYVHNANAKIGCTKGCSVESSTLTGQSYAGGFIGYLDKGTVNNCEAACAVDAYGQAGGFLGLLNAGSLTDNTASGTVNTHNQVGGGFIGTMAAGTVTNCSAEGNVDDNKGTYSQVGGLIGKMTGGSVLHCHATGNCTGVGHQIGGLIGVVAGNGTVSISTSYAAGSASNSADKNRMGGLIGDIDSSPTVTISNCYATGSVSGKNYNGGFIGNVNGSATVTVTNGYTTSAISGGKWNSGVFGGGINGTVTCTGFVGWNTSNRAVWYYNGGSSAPTGNYMGTDGTVYSQAVALGGWDFTNVWTTDDIPQLR